MAREVSTDLKEPANDASPGDSAGAGDRHEPTPALTLTDDEVELVITKITSAAETVLHSVPEAGPAGDKRGD